MNIYECVCVCVVEKYMMYGYPILLLAINQQITSYTFYLMKSYIYA